MPESVRAFERLVRERAGLVGGDEEDEAQAKAA
jgi:hypothetical protein